MKTRLTSLANQTSLKKDEKDRERRKKIGKKRDYLKSVPK
jgi:hypothetical protein